jgi:HEAT repeat protein
LTGCRRWCPVCSASGYVQDPRLLAALADGNSSTRLKAALALGTRPEPGFVDVLVARCAIEPDFFVRDMLTWALTRLPSEVTVPRLSAQLRSGRAQARSQALHTLSKIGDRRAWPAITRSLLHDADDEVARSAWRAAVVLVPEEEKEALAAELAAGFGRGDREVRLSLSQALVALGDVVEPVLRTAMTHHDPAVRAHASATQRLWRDPDAGFDLAVDEARRVVALGPDREETSAC